MGFNIYQMLIIHVRVYYSRLKEDKLKKWSAPCSIHWYFIEHLERLETTSDL